jgi:hypothetical protein
MACTRSDFFQGQMARGLFYWPNNSGEIWLSKREEEGAIFMTFRIEIIFGLTWKGVKNLDQ